MSDYIEIASTSSIESIDNCIICFYPLEYEIAELSCGHKYHFDCLKAWISKEKQKNIGNLCCICNKNDIEIKTIFNNKDSVYENIVNYESDFDIDAENVATPETESESTNQEETNIPIESIFFCCTIL